jgi:hypothetical protein
LKYKKGGEEIQKSVRSPLSFSRNAMEAEGTEKAKHAQRVEQLTQLILNPEASLALRQIAGELLRWNTLLEDFNLSEDFDPVLKKDDDRRKGPPVRCCSTLLAQRRPRLSKTQSMGLFPGGSADIRLLSAVDYCLLACLMRRLEAYLQKARKHLVKELKPPVSY